MSVLAALSVGLFAVVAVLSVCALLFNVYDRFRAQYRCGRAAFAEEALRRGPADATGEELARVLRPRRPGDAAIMEEALLKSMRLPRGPVFERLRLAAVSLGLVERNLRRLRSRRPHERGRAMRALGILRVPEAVPALCAVLDGERLDLKLIALRALAEIGDPAAIPYLIAAAYQLPRAMIVGLGALLMEFGPPGRRGIQTLVARFPSSFPPQVMMDLLRQVAAAGEDGA